MRRWGIEQLRFLDELYQVGRGHHLFPIDADLIPTPAEIDQHILNALQFTGDWALPRVSDLLLSVSIELRVPICLVRERLHEWLLQFPGFVAPVRVSERMILYGRSQRIRELTMAGYLTPSGRGLVSHLKVHNGIQTALGGEPPIWENK